MRSPGWYALALALAATAATFGAHVALAHVGRPYLMQVPMIASAFASTLIWAGYVTRSIGRRRGRAVQALVAAVVVVGGGIAGFVLLYATGYVGLAVVLAVYAAPLFGEARPP